MQPARDIEYKAGQAGFEKALSSDSVADKMSTIAALPEANRATIAHFCYQRVHLRELGLRIVATCSLPTLKRAFGTSAQMVHEQAQNIDSVTKELNRATSPANSLLFKIG